MNFRQRLKKRSRPSFKEVQIGWFEKTKNGYKMQLFMSIHCILVKNSDVMKIKKHWVGDGAAVVLKVKGYDWV